MVAGSLGAYDALRFTDLNRQSVVGMVLVDPSIPDQDAIESRLAPKIAALSSPRLLQAVKQLQDCAAGLRRSTLKRGTPQFERCTAAPAYLNADFSRLKVALARLNADPARLLTQASSLQYVPEDEREVINAKRQYGDLPLTVLTRGRNDLGSLPPGTPGASTPAEVADLRQEYARWYQDAWIPAHDAYAALSTRGRNQLVPDSGHDISDEKPEAVIAAVTEVLDEIGPATPQTRGSQP
jgi:pimeloyl-ACP methyl ester carboxylesterase